MKIERQAWTITEIKPTFVFVYQAYLDARRNYFLGLQGLDHKEKTKREFIAALDAFYSLSAGLFNDWLESENNNTGYTAENYENLFIDQPEDNKLVKMANCLNRWNSRDGFFKIYDSITSFGDGVDGAVEEVLNEENI